MGNREKGQDFSRLRQNVQKCYSTFNFYYANNISAGIFNPLYKDLTIFNVNCLFRPNISLTLLWLPIYFAISDLVIFICSILKIMASTGSGEESENVLFRMLQLL